MNCLDQEQIQRLQDRFVFVEYNPSITKPEVSPYTIMLNDKPLSMTKITLSDFLPLYDALKSKRAKLPVRILRRFKQELYSYIVTNTTTNTLRVASIEDTRVSDEELVLAIGRADQIGVKGLNGIRGDDWYRDIVLGDLVFTADEMLEQSFPIQIKQNSNRLPVNKYLSLAKKDYPECRELARKLTIDNIIPPSILKYRGNSGYHSVSEVWQNEKPNYERSSRLILELNKDEIQVEELEAVLHDIFSDKDILNRVSGIERTSIRRLILIYDYLKWGGK